MNRPQLDQGSSTSATVEVMSDTAKLAYSPEEVAQLLGLHPNTVYAMLKSGELPGIKAGRKWLISVKGLELWLAGGIR